MTETNTLIVGQGIAGSLVAYLLYRHGISFTVIDRGQGNTASRIAAGMFTPVTGKRKTIDPLVAQQIELALSMYRSIGELIGSTILHVEDVYHLYQSGLERASFELKMKQPGFEKYIVPNPLPIPRLKQEAGACGITYSGWVDCETWLGGFATWLQQRRALIQESFDYAALQVSEDGLNYKGMNFKNLICCEGYDVRANPFFNEAGIIPCKGNLLTIRCESLQATQIIKKNGIYLVPLGQAIFKVGATYQWNDDSQHPDLPSKTVLGEKLDDILDVPYTVLEQKAAVRPTTADRNVIAQQHPLFKNIFMLNGLGTKGILQAPWWANQLVNLSKGSAK